MEHINIKLKLRSLLRRRDPFHCLSYDWQQNKIIVHPSQLHFQSELADLATNSMVKRAECYYEQPFEANNQLYLLYLVSYGDFRKSKMVRGENPIAGGLGICMFDYVFLFLEPLTEARIRMEQRMQQLGERGEYFHRNLMMELHYKLFGEKEENTAFTEVMEPQKTCEEQKQESFPI